MGVISLGLIGSAGRMGTALREYLAAVDDIVLRACLEVGESLAEFLAQQPQVVVDLSLGAAVDGHGPQVVRAGIPYIVGATGYARETVELLRAAALESGTPVLIVPNFSLGANLLIRFAATAANLMESPVITERHHAAKADAPSGTARFTAARIAEARGPRVEGASRDSSAEHYREEVRGVLGGREHGVPIHSVRGAGYLAEQAVQFSLPGESLMIEHRSIDRRSFMPGIVFAIRNVGRVQGLQIGLDTIFES